MFVFILFSKHRTSKSKVWNIYLHEQLKFMANVYIDIGLYYMFFTQSIWDIHGDHGAYGNIWDRI